MWHRYPGFVAAHRALFAAHQRLQMNPSCAPGYHHVEGLDYCVPDSDNQGGMWLDLPAKYGTLPSNWWSMPAPQPPATAHGQRWVQVLPPHPHRFNEAQQGVVFDPDREHGYLAPVQRIWQTPQGNYVATAWVDDALLPQQQTQWIAGSFSASKPSNASTQWIEITHQPGQGPTINGKPTQQGRGVLHHDDGSADFVVVYNVMQDHPSGWLVEVGVYEDTAMPQCPASQAIYSRSANGNWPPGHPQQYLCGIPRGEKGDLDIFTLPSPVANPLPPPPPGGGQPGQPSGGQPAPATFSGLMVKEPKGEWLPATFFAEPPPRRRFHLGAQWWLQINTPPGYQGSRFGHGVLHHGDKSKDVLIVEIDSTNQQHVRARYVPNDQPMLEDKPSPPAPTSSPPGHVGGQGFAPFSTPQPPQGPRLRAKRPMMRAMRRW